MIIFKKYNINLKHMDTILSTIEIEKLLDDDIGKYNIFNNTNPMQGVYLSPKQKWRFMDDYHDTTDKKFRAIKKFAKKALLPTTAHLLTENKPESENFCNKTYAIYQGHLFVSFWYNEEPLFDIQHIISVLNLKPASHIKKYDEYKTQISHYVWHENEYRGYILRELISKETAFLIIHSCQNIQIDFVDILTELRETKITLLVNQTKNIDNAQNQHNTDMSVCNATIVPNRDISAPYDTTPKLSILSRSKLLPSESRILPKPFPSESRESSKLKRKTIKRPVRRDVWHKYAGTRTESKCYTGCGNKICCFNFVCGHVIAASKGGEATVANLRPICTMCNSSMGTMYLYDYMNECGLPGVTRDNTN